MYDDVVARLGSLGYEVLPDDRYAIEFAVEKVSWKIYNLCHIPEIPEGLWYIAVDMVCGEFLSAKKKLGQLEGFNTEIAVKAIKEGDTQVTYAIGDTGDPLDWLITYMLTHSKGQLVTYRRLLW